MFLGKGVLKICSTCTGEHLCRSTISIKLQSNFTEIALRHGYTYAGEHLCRSAISIKLQSNFIEIALRHGYSSVNLLHIFRTPFPKNTSGGLLLKKVR